MKEVKGYSIKIGDIDKYVAGYIDPIALTTLSRAGAEITEARADGTIKKWSQLPTRN